MRGEKNTTVDTWTRKAGSSPHARGKATRLKTIQVIFRIIPACAGKRGHNQRHLHMSQDHPRMRGEKG